jgi:hypothetical protein
MNPAEKGRAIEKANPKFGNAPASKWNPDIRLKLLQAAATGATQGLCAEVAGISGETLRAWLNDTDDDEKAAFAAAFRQARASRHLDMHQAILDAGITDWRASMTLLERVRDDYRGAPSHASVVTGTEGGQTLSPKQIDHRVVRMIAHPDKRMLELLRRALQEANPTVQALVREHVESRQATELRETSIDTDGVEQGDEPTEPEAPPPPDADLDLRLSRWFDVLRKFDRIALTGGPLAGKTTVFGAAVTDRRVVHTDDWRDKPWEMVPQLAASACVSAGRYVCEGVRAAAIQRHGAEPQVVVWLSKPLPPMDSLSAEHQQMWRARETALAKLRAEYPKPEVVVI